MDSSSIMAHKESNTLIIRKNTNYTKPVNLKANLMAGMNSRFMESITVDGDLVLGKGAQIMGDAKAKNVVLGPWAVIRGNLTVSGELLALDNSKVLGNVKCYGSVITRPGVVFRSLDATGLVEYYGKKPAGKIRSKMITKKDD
ncbi:MAG TPA: polymer-forming cytoskeletal protein [Methanocella sp.]|nr:polymer-forming cytoskeletal protein [Methanocella sp.]